MIKMTLKEKGKNAMKLTRFFKEEEGATMPEYALMVSLIAMACFLAVTALGGQTNVIFNSLANLLPTP